MTVKLRSNSDLQNRSSTGGEKTPAKGKAVQVCAIPVTVVNLQWQLRVCREVAEVEEGQAQASSSSTSEMEQQDRLLPKSWGDPCHLSDLPLASNSRFMLGKQSCQMSSLPRSFNSPFDPR